MPKPLPDEYGNAFKVNFALFRDRKNLFRMEDGQLLPEAKAAMAGVLEPPAGDDAVFESRPQQLRPPDRRRDPQPRLLVAPARTNAVRVPLPQHRFARCRSRAPIAFRNAYLAYALLILAALEGIERKEELPAAVSEIGRPCRRCPNRSSAPSTRPRTARSSNARCLKASSRLSCTKPGIWCKGISRTKPACLKNSSNAFKTRFTISLRCRMVFPHSDRIRQRICF